MRLDDLKWQPYGGDRKWERALFGRFSIFRCIVDNHHTTPKGHYWMVNSKTGVGLVMDPIEAQCMVYALLEKEYGNGHE